MLFKVKKSFCVRVAECLIKSSLAFFSISKTEYRVVIKRLNLKGITPLQIHDSVPFKRKKSANLRNYVRRIRS